MRTRPRAQAAAALVLTVLLGLPDLLLTPSAGAGRAGALVTGAGFPDTTADTDVTFRGLAFDSCRAPSLAVMSAWRKASPYGAVGVPYAGRGRACPDQPHLTRRWVAEVHRMGWRVLPVFVGSQPPCAHDPRPASGASPESPGVSPGSPGTLRPAPGTSPGAPGTPPKTPIGGAPAVQGGREGEEAVRTAGALGMDRGSALYLSLKSYDLDDASCVRTTLDFVRAWNREVRRQGYVPGLHSDADAGVLHMERARRAGTGDLPSALWFVRWNRRPSLYDEAALHPYAWRVKRRIHQYAGEITEEHGGHRLTIGRSMADAPVARVRI
ncbi:DUF1906 domain-containing protein [Streptomyces katsurahamanus]|uniref:DUF1906 domain-containing protein n=1 Tax=Streptomyces katsurahamanus TaxID=2577098 RepID=A0ABW9NWZ3_9ACTN|nr:DUF1906 domain-containing protein [Streptomyces katsurahamanus]MQS37797.1 DUF1906 domain-containing protein [Streptomyces katsurahamanus]